MATIIIARQANIKEYLIKQGLIQGNELVKELPSVDDIKGKTVIYTTEIQNNDVVCSLSVGLAKYAKNLVEIEIRLPTSKKVTDSLTMAQLERYAQDPIFYYIHENQREQQKAQKVTTIVYDYLEHIEQETKDQILEQFENLSHKETHMIITINKHKVLFIMDIYKVNYLAEQIKKNPCLLNKVPFHLLASHMIVDDGTKEALIDIKNNNPKPSTVMYLNKLVTKRINIRSLAKEWIREKGIYILNSYDYTSTSYVYDKELWHCLYLGME